MPKATHYTPALDRFLVSALYHQAKAEQIPMTQLVNRIVQQALHGGTGWQTAIASKSNTAASPVAAAA